MVEACMSTGTAVFRDWTLVCDKGVSTAFARCRAESLDTTKDCAVPITPSMLAKEQVNLLALC